MKLRNKETGKVQTCDMVVITDEPIDGEIASLNKHTFIFRSIEQFNDEYEAYKPKEPLLKGYPDEMRAIKAYGCSPLRFHRHARKGYSTFNFCSHYICFDRLFENLKDGKAYTIAELCGEEAPEPLEPSFVDLDERIKEKASEKLYKGENDIHLREEEK